MFSQPESPSDDDIGKRCGRGQYRIWKYEGSKMPLYREIIISDAYGEPRAPRVIQETMRPRPFGVRPQDNYDDPNQPRVIYRPMGRPGYYEPGMGVEGGRPTNESVAVTAVTKLSELNERAFERLEKHQQPPSVVTDFLKEQQLAIQKQRDEDARRADDIRRRDQEESSRREEEREAQHRRDMERIKEESAARVAAEKETRQTLLDLEQKKIDLIKQDADAREKVLRADLDRIRAEAKEERQTLLVQLEKLQKKTDDQISQVQEGVDEEIKKGQENLNREHDLRTKHLDSEHSLKEQILKIREEMAKNQQGDEITKTVGKLIDGLERTIKEVVDLKKIEAVSAEERMANVAQQQSGGNLQTVQPGPAAPPPAEPHPALQGKAGNGHTVEPVKEKESVDKFVEQMSREPFFQEVLAEWGRHVKAGANATTFANMFMEWMRDDGTPEGLRARKACSVFVNHMQIRSWPEMYDVIKPALPKEFEKAFESTHASEFYEQFRLMVVSSVDDYWKAYLAEKQARVEAEKQAAQRQPAVPAVQARPAVPAAPAVAVAT